VVVDAPLVRVYNFLREFSLSLSTLQSLLTREEEEEEEEENREAHLRLDMFFLFFSRRCCCYRELKSRLPT